MVAVLIGVPMAVMVLGIGMIVGVMARDAFAVARSRAEDPQRAWLRELLDRGGRP
jgi:hypothetical protein